MAQTPYGYADEYNRWPKATPPKTAQAGVDPYAVADAYLRSLEDRRLGRMQQEKYEAQNYDQYLFGRNEARQRRNEAAGLEAQRQLAGLQPNPVQSGPILTETVNPGGMFSGARGPRVITGGYGQAALTMQDQFRDKMLSMLDSMMGLASGKAPGVDYDAILNSMNADMTKHYAGQRNQMADRFAGLGRSMSSTAANEAMGGLGEMEGRQGLANRAEVEKLRIQGNSYYNSLLANVLPMVMKMYAGTFGGGA